MPSAPPTTRRICVRCQLRYCSQDCQQHYWRSGHQENCEIIHRGGDAEQYHAEKKYKWAVSVAVEACAEDTTGQIRLAAANNYANTLLELRRFEEAKALLRKTVPVARRVIGENDGITLGMRKVYARALYEDPAATLDDLREAVTTLEESERTARRVLGGAHPLTMGIGRDLQKSRAALRAREMLSQLLSPPPPGSA